MSRRSRLAYLLLLLGTRGYWRTEQTLASSQRDILKLHPFSFFVWCRVGGATLGPSYLLAPSWRRAASAAHPAAVTTRTEPEEVTVRRSGETLSQPFHD